jgi:hypothetical protein
VNSREKGKRGERAWRDELRANGFKARRGQQFAGSSESPDVVCDDLPWAHFEVKAVERLNIEDAMAQARRDAAAKVPFVAHKRNFRPWLVTMTAETFFRLLRGELPPTQDHETTGPSEKLKAESLKAERGTTGQKDNGARGATRPTSELDGGRSATRPTPDEIREQKAEGGSHQ